MLEIKINAMFLGHAPKFSFLLAVQVCVVLSDLADAIQLVEGWKVDWNDWNGFELEQPMDPRPAVPIGFTNSLPCKT